MGKWVDTTIGAYCDPPQYGLNASAIKYDGEHGYIRITDIDDTSHRFIKSGITSPDEFSDEYLVKKGDVLLARTGASVGKSYVYDDRDGQLYFAGFLIRFRPKKDNDPGFLFYQTLTDRYARWVANVSVRTGQPGINSLEYATYKFLAPVSLDEQRHIAEILTTCDEVIEKSEAVAEKYRAIKAGMLKDLFTRGIGKNGKLRPPPESTPQHYKDTALGKVPREWEVKSFDSAFELHGNNTLSRAFLTNQNGAVRNIHYGDVLVKYDTILDCDDEALPSVIAEGVRQAGNDYLQNGDLVFADTAEDDTVGKAVELYNVGDRTIVSGLHTIFARPKEDDFASRWLGYYVNSDSFHKQLLPFVVGSKVSSISRTNIKRTFVVIPESDEQQQIAERLSAIDAKIADELAVIAKYRKVKAGLMARLLTPPPDVKIVDGGVE